LLWLPATLHFVLTQPDFIMSRLSLTAYVLRPYRQSLSRPHHLTHSITIASIFTLFITKREPPCASEAMASGDSTHTTHNQTVYLKADQPPPFYQQSVRHWVISAIEGDPPATLAKEHELRLKDFPNRIVTLPILHHLCTRLILSILLLVLTSAVLVRARPSQQRINQRAALCLVLGILVSACFDCVETCTVGLTAYLALVGLPFEALIVLGIQVLAYKGWTITAISLTVAFTTSAASSHVVRNLPDYDTFFANLRPSGSISSAERGCLVCWESEATLFQMPCHRSHLVCEACLSRLHAADKGDCPLCRQSIFTYKSRDKRNEIRHFIITSAIATLVLSLVTIALQLYKGCYLSAALYVLPILEVGAFALILLALLPEKKYLATMNLSVLWFLLAYAVFMFRNSAARLHTWDQVTFWDGVVLKGVQVWDTVPVGVPVGVEHI
jgi:hypothetical protein